VDPENPGGVTQAAQGATHSLNCRLQLLPFHSQVQPFGAHSVVVLVPVVVLEVLLVAVVVVVVVPVVELVEPVVVLVDVELVVVLVVVVVGVQSTHRPETLVGQPAAAVARRAIVGRQRSSI